MNRTEVAKLAVDCYKGKIAGNFSVEDSSEVLRQALIEANGGSDKISYKSIRKNKGELFEIIEEIIPKLLVEGLKGDEFYTSLVEERRLNEGDKNEFVVDENSTFVVSKLANGIATPRRQRIGEKTTKSVDTEAHTIRMYEELSRVLSGRISWNEFVDKLADAYKKNLYNDIYTVFSGITASTTGMNTTYYPTAGSYSEANLLTLVEHVEAATGKTAKIIGTKTALRKVTTAQVSDQAKNDYYNAGYYGKVAGVEMVAVKNTHKVGTDTFIFPDNKLYIMASDDNPIKVVYEGDALILDKDPITNADLSMEYLYIEKYGVSLILNGKLGIYEISA